ncbi:MAG: MerR family transcriptional regulator [Bryobacterales bacterium]|nr:MerR family transcriptional regulator [Bryobacterales bacterium]
MRNVHPAPQAGSTPEIPDKLYFRIGEVSHLAGVEPYVLRYWESEFPSLAPKKSGTGHRLYRRKDVEMVLELKRLLYEKRFTIEGARLYLDQNKKKATIKTAPVPKSQGDLFAPPPAAATDLSGIRKELAEIVKLLS